MAINWLTLYFLSSHIFSGIFVYSQCHLPAHVNGKLRVQSTGGTVGHVAFSTNGWLNFILSWLFKVRTDKALVQEVEKKVSSTDIL